MAVSGNSANQKKSKKTSCFFVQSGEMVAKSVLKKVVHAVTKCKKHQQGRCLRQRQIAKPFILREGFCKNWQNATKTSCFIVQSGDSGGKVRSFENQMQKTPAGASAWHIFCMFALTKPKPLVDGFGIWQHGGFFKNTDPARRICSLVTWRAYSAHVLFFRVLIDKTRCFCNVMIYLNAFYRAK